MDQSVIEFLNHFSAGDAVLFVLGVGFVLFNVYKTAHVVAKKHEAYIQKKMEDEQNRKSLIAGIEEVQTELTSLKEELDELRNRHNTRWDDVCSDHQHLTTAVQDANTHILNFTEDIKKIEDRIYKAENQIRILFKTDVEYVKAYLVDAHNLYVKEKKPIDLITLQNFEGIYNRYLTENEDGRDDFLEKIMEDLRRLPTKSK